MHLNVFDLAQLLTQSTQPYHEFLRVSSLSAGIYVLDGGAIDHQKPHSEDEVYYVVDGRAKMRTNSDGDFNTFDVGPGTIIFMPARMHHALRRCASTRLVRFSFQSNFNRPAIWFTKCIRLGLAISLENLWLSIAPPS